MRRKSKNASKANAETADNADPSAETSCTAASNAEENRNADSDSNVNAEANVSAEIQSTAEGNECSGGDDGQKQADAPRSTESAPPEQSNREKTRGREIADLSEFCGRGDKRYHPSGENRNLGVYCGNNEVLSANARGSPQKEQHKNSIHNSNKHSLTYKLYQL